MPVMGVTKFQRLFRVAAELQVDRNDLKRYSDFVNDKIYDVFLIAQAHARANHRDIIEPWDLPVTKACKRASTSSRNWTTRSSWHRYLPRSPPGHP
jgi:hypothetical protein